MLADDHTILVEAFRKLLEPHFEVVGTVSDGRALLEAAPQLKPDVIIVDIGMPLMNGLEAASRLKELMPAVKLIFLTMNEDPDLAVEAIRQGASGYLLKSSAASELIRAIQMSLKAKPYITPKIARLMQRAFINNPRPRARAKTLTPRQREVVQLLAEGKSMKEVADVLNVTPRTVAFHKYRIMEELSLKTTADLIQFAIKSRILVN
jgi:DNA-binding NarL/FixJ family response regulator